MKKQLLLPLFSLSLLLPLAACGTGTGSEGGDGDGDCAGAKCDDLEPTDQWVEDCDERRAQVANSSQATFTDTHIRWSCRDVDSRFGTPGQRGQEYCEYFAVAQIPNGAEGRDPDDPNSVDTITFGQKDQGGAQNAEGIDLTDDQLDALEDAGDDVVGSCVFTSWHQDVDEPMPNAATTLFGLPLDADNFKMKVTINSNSAAADLFQKGLVHAAAGVNGLEEVDSLNETGVFGSTIRGETLYARSVEDDFIRGCLGTGAFFGTQWRRSDPAVVAVATRMVECGCSVEGAGNTLEISRAVVPAVESSSAGNVNLRGFPLGTWTGDKELPSGCTFVETGEEQNSQTIVSCELTGNEVVDNSDDIQGFCGEKYGNNVVVHVPIPQVGVSCEAPGASDNNPHGDAPGCGARPWEIFNEGELEGGDVCGDGVCGDTEDADSCAQDCGDTCGDGVCSDSETAETCAEDCDAGDNLDSCEARGCGDFNPEASCQCNELCVEIGDCCGDFEPICGGGEPDEGACCEENGSPSCNDSEVSACVCDLDPFCCGEDEGGEGHWDSLCVEQASEQCGATCG